MTMTEQARPTTDTMSLLQAVARVGDVNRADLLELLRPGWSQDRVDAAVAAASGHGLLQHGATTARLQLSITGRRILEGQQQQRAEPPERDTRPPLERYRAAALEALPAFTERRRQAQREAEQERQWAATQAWGTALGFFRSLPAFADDWQCITEMDTRFGPLALRPRFPAPGESGVYLRLWPEPDGVWLRSSTDGPPVWLPKDASRVQVVEALGLALFAAGEEHP